MRVLDVGCGVGDVAMLAARIVGTTGSIVGIDLNPESIALARRRAVEGGYKTIEFKEISLHEFEERRAFDFAVGRYVLIHQADSAAAVRQIAKSVKPNGTVAIHELAAHLGLRSYPPVALWEQVGEWLAAFTRAGANPYAAMQIPRCLERAGLIDVDAFCETPVAYGKHPHLYAWVAETQRTLLPTYVERGIVSAEELDVDTLALRLESAVVAAGSLVMAWPQVCGWATAAE